jgi:hypothetical protein
MIQVTGQEIMFHMYTTRAVYRMVTNDVSDSYQKIYVIAHIICNHPIYF